jgi:nucleotide-binding universal stress UspA family protein
MNSWTRTGPVVVEVDGSSDGLRVVDYAAQDALHAGADLVLVAPFYNHGSYPPMTPLHQQASPSEDAAATLRDAADQVKRRHGRDLVVKNIAMEGSRLKVLRTAAREARVLVVGRDHDNGPAGLISAQGNLALAGHLRCPVIVVPTAWRPNPAEHSIAVGIDGTPLSLPAVEFAFRTAAERRTGLTVVHSHHLPYRLPADDVWTERAGLTVAETLAGWDEEFPQVTVTRLLTTQPVVASLARESEHAALIIVGAHAGPLPIGDPVARRTIAELPCPVAIVAHHVTSAERDQQRREIPGRLDTFAPIN